MSDQLVTRLLPNTGQHKHRINAIGYEPMIPASKRAKIVHASDRIATVTGMNCKYSDKKKIVY
jgi:hypothetical protein